jgi:hypothetical protein
VFRCFSPFFPEIYSGPPPFSAEILGRGRSGGQNNSVAETARLPGTSSASALMGFMIMMIIMKVWPFVLSQNQMGSEVTP